MCMYIKTEIAIVDGEKRALDIILHKTGRYEFQSEYNGIVVRHVVIGNEEEAKQDKNYTKIKVDEVTFHCIEEFMGYL